MIPSGLRRRDRLGAFAVSWLAWAFLHFVAKTSRVHSHYHPAARLLLDEGKPFIYAFWHRFQLFLVYDQRGRGINVLVSRSRDGELIARALDRFGFRTVRGSSSRGGVAALLELLNLLRAGKTVGVTPDGPRGPFRSVQPGVIALARKTGAPVLPLAWAGSKVKELSSWDRFLVPRPFGRLEVVLGEPFRIGPKEDGAEDKVRGALDAVAAEAVRLLAEPHPL